MKDYKNLDGWVFVYNSNTQIWSATPRDNYFALFNGGNDRVLKSGNVNTLADIIAITDGNKSKINKLTK